jgi:hypothetical protein
MSMDEEQEWHPDGADIGWPLLITLLSFMVTPGLLMIGLAMMIR